MNVIILIFYECILWLLAILALPRMIFQFFYNKKYHHSFLPRLGFRYPTFKKHTLPSIWIHAVSMGETKAVVSLARELKRCFPDNPLIISSVSETGHAEAKRSLPFAEYHVYLPFDFNGIVKKIVKNASPGLIILCESDFWFNFLSYAKKQGAGLALVSGKMSERSMNRFSWVPFFSKRLFGLFDVFCVQNDLYRSRFITAGAPENRLVVTGNLKLDDDYPQLSHEEIIDWRQKLGIQPDQKVLTIGSMHAAEQPFIFPVLKEIFKKAPDLRVILVPRRPEQFKEIGLSLERERLIWINFSDIARRTGKEQVILVDAMGLLRMCYQLSDYAFVGGSFTDKVGGHNILEPCWYGKPVLFGPHMHTQPELVDLVLRYKAGFQVNKEQLQETLETWIKHPEEALAIGANGVRLVKDLKGSMKRTFHALEPLFSKLV